MFRAKKMFHSFILNLGLENHLQLQTTNTNQHLSAAVLSTARCEEQLLWQHICLFLPETWSFSFHVLQLLQTFCAPSSLWEVWRSSVMVDAEMLFLLSASSCLSLTSVGFSVRFINTSVSSSLSLSVLTRHVLACPLVLRGLRPPHCEGTDLICSTSFTVYLLHDERRHCRHFSNCETQRRGEKICRRTRIRDSLRRTYLKAKLSTKCTRVFFFCDCTRVKPLCNSIITMKEALLRFTLVRFSVKLKIKSWKSHVRSLVDSCCWKTVVPP